MITICELQKLEAKIKYHVTLNKNQLCIALRIEPSPSDETFECYCRGKIKNNVKTILVNKITGEKKEYESIYSCAKGLGKNPSSISYDIKTCNHIRCYCEKLYIVKIVR